MDEGGALMIGPRRSVPSGYSAVWHLELQAQSLDNATLARAMLAWNRPVAVAGAQPSEPGDQIYAVVVTRAEKRKTEALVTVGRDEFQDIRLEMLPGATAACEEVQ